MQPLFKGMPARMAILDFGLFQVHQNRRTIGICGYLIETTEGERVLIDSGFPPRYAENAEGASAADGLEDFGTVLALDHGNLAPAQLALLDLAPSDIDLMVQSHTHIDHIGFMGAFPTVPILMAKAERDLPHPLSWPGAAPIEWPAAEYLTIDCDTLLGPGFEALMVPGHTSGQLAFALHLPKTGPILLTSDAISRADEIDTKFAGAWDSGLAFHHARRLFARATRDRSMIIYGHSPDQWPKLRKAPQWYD